MSLQDKINSAKPTTFLTDGLSPKEVRECVKKGKERMKLTEFLDDRYKNRKDKDNIYGVGISDAEFRQFMIDYILGEDWYVADPLGQNQINEIALDLILVKCSRKYRIEKARAKYDRNNTM